MATFFCPSCWIEVNAEQENCSNCGFVLADYDQLSFEEKLLAALNHSVFERRVMAAQILGGLGSTRALVPFNDILLRDDIDYYFARAILEALSRIENPDSTRIIEQAAAHHNDLIREFAQDLLSLKQQ